MRILDFSGYRWTANEEQNTWIDESGNLHLKVGRNAALVSLSQTLGYGIYNFFLIGRIDRFEENILASLSLDTNETSKIAIQFSRWTPAKNIVYPYDIKSKNVAYIARNGKKEGTWPDGYSQSIWMDLNGTYSTHRIIWQPNSLSMLSLHGHYEAEPPSPDFVVHSFQFRFADCPVSDTERVMMSIAPKNKALLLYADAELVVARFLFQPFSE